MTGNFARTFLFMLAGPLIWAAHFLFIYAVNGVNCARPALHATWLGLDAALWIIVAASLFALLAMAAIFLRHYLRMPSSAAMGFVPWLAGALSLLSAIAIVWETMPVLLVPACA
jgi:hypothetical protein